jgi:hypothetical protein
MSASLFPQRLNDRELAIWATKIPQVITTATGDGPHSATRPLAPTIAYVATAPKDIVIAPPPQSAPIALPRPKPRLVSDQPPAGDVNDYVIARLQAAVKHQLEFSGTYRDYEAWCAAQKLRALTVEQFAETLKGICTAAVRCVFNTTPEPKTTDDSEPVAFSTRSSPNAACLAFQPR